MSKVQLQGNVSGTGIFTIASPNSNTNRTIDLPDAAGTIQVSGNPISGTTGTFTGLLNISAAGAGQIQFPATQNASSNANTLDDYEEGTWTPTVNYNGGSFSAATAYYTKIGRLVNISLTVNYNAAAGVGVNLNSISGLPFQNSSSQSIPAPCGLFYIMTTSTGDNNTCFPGFILGGNSSEITLYTSQSGSTEGRPRFNSVNSYMQINCTYIAT